MRAYIESASGARGRSRVTREAILSASEHLRENSGAEKHFKSLCQALMSRHL